MPYILLIAGLGLGVFGLYRFFASADPAQATAMMKSLIAAALLCVMVLLALTGRGAAALGIAVALVPFLVDWRTAAARLSGKKPKNARQGEINAPLSGRKEALAVLGLMEGASAEEINAAYRDLIKKLHPDHGGNDYLAQRITAARDYLLKDGR